MKKVELYNKIMLGLSNIVHQHLNESMRKVKYALYSEIYSPEEQYEIEKMIVRADLIDQKYIEEDSYFSKTLNRECPLFQIHFEHMTIDEASIAIANIEWGHPFAFISIEDYDQESANVILPNCDDISVYIEFDVDYRYYPGSSGTYYDPPEPSEVEITNFTITNAYIEIWKNGKTEKRNLNLNAINHKGKKLLDVLYEICESDTDLYENLCNDYEESRWR